LAHRLQQQEEQLAHDERLAYELQQREEAAATASTGTSGDAASSAIPPYIASPYHPHSQQLLPSQNALPSAIATPTTSTSTSSSTASMQVASYGQEHERDSYESIAAPSPYRTIPKVASSNNIGGNVGPRLFSHDRVVPQPFLPHYHTLPTPSVLSPINDGRSMAVPSSYHGGASVGVGVGAYETERESVIRQQRELEDARLARELATREDQRLATALQRREELEASERNNHNHNSQHINDNGVGVDRVIPMEMRMASSNSHNNNSGFHMSSNGDGIFVSYRSSPSGNIGTAATTTTIGRGAAGDHPSPQHVFADAIHMPSVYQCCLLPQTFICICRVMTVMVNEIVIW
jgi:hypothetical protein